MASNKAKAEQRKKLMLAGLGLALALVVAYQLLFSDPTPKRRTTANGNAGQTATRPSGRGNTSAPAPRQNSADQTAQPVTTEIADDLDPLDFSLIQARAESAKVGERGNIFAYYVPPPPPKKPDPPPPPITLQSLQPSSAIAGVPRPFTLTVTGVGYTDDAQIFIDGSPRQSKRVGPNALATQIAPAEYAGQRQMTVEVKSLADPAKLYSTQLAFTVSPAPEPSFKYIGRIGGYGVYDLNPGENDPLRKQIERKKVGESIQNTWRVDALDDSGTQLTHMQLEIKRQIPLERSPRQ